MSEPARDVAVIEARAKVNLFLRVVARRNDGFHDLETLVVPISLADRLEIRARSNAATFETLSLSLDVTGDPELVRDVPVDESNLVLRAATALAGRAEVKGFTDVVLEKHVPAGGGLGGGSSDAAAILTALNELWGCGLDDEALREIGSNVGSDIPALLVGGAVLARGRGEQVEPVAMARLDLALATFSFSVSTADAFRWWDEDGANSGAPIDALLTELAPPDVTGGSAPSEPFLSLLQNDLEDGVVRRNPVIGHVRELLRRGGTTAVVMSGSGPSLVAVLGPDGNRLDQRIEDEVEGISGRPLAYVTTEPLRG